MHENKLWRTFTNLFDAEVLTPAMAAANRAGALRNAAVNHNLHLRLTPAQRTRLNTWITELETLMADPLVAVIQSETEPDHQTEPATIGVN